MLRAIVTGLLLTVFAAMPGWAGDEQEIGRFQIFTGTLSIETDPLGIRDNPVYGGMREAMFMVDTVTGQTWVFQPDSEDGKWRWRKASYEGFSYNCYFPEACD
jgi:hypothetical protein